MSAVVFLVYFLILGIIVWENAQKGFIALLLGTMIFPCCALFSESPAISGQIVLLYVYMAKLVLVETHEVKRAIFDGPLKYFLLLIVLSYVITTIFNFNPMNAYYATRDMIDLYCYFIAATVASKNLTMKDVSGSLYWFVLCMCVYGLYEAATDSNIIYKIVNSAFPAYDGFYELDGQIDASEDWRIRTIILTKHPTTLGNLLMILFLFYWNVFQKKSMGFWKNMAILALLGLNVYFSGSRTSLACVGIMLIYTYVKTKGIFTKILFVTALVFSASYMVNYAIDNLMDSKDGSSLMLRMTQLAFSFEKISESPIWGNGSNYTAHEIKDDDVRFNDDNEFIGGLESVAFIYMIDRGLYGVLSFYLFWIMAALYLRKNNELYEPNRVTLEIMPMGIILFLTMSGLIGNNTAFCFLFAGLYIGEVQKDRLERDEAEEKEMKKAPEISAAS